MDLAKLLMYSTKVMSKEFANYKIRVNCVAPSVTNTSMTKFMSKQSIMNLLKKSN